MASISIPFGDDDDYRQRLARKTVELPESEYHEVKEEVAVEPKKWAGGYWF